MSGKKGAKKVVSRVHLPETGEKVPFVLSWEFFEGRDGAIHCKPIGDCPRHMRAVAKSWRSDPKAVREMERRRSGKMKGSALDEEASPSPAAELGEADEEK